MGNSSGHQPFKYRVLSIKTRNGVAGYAGTIVTDICVEGRFHVQYSRSEYDSKPANDDSIEMSACKCNRYTVVAEPWLDRAIRKKLKGKNPAR